MRRLILLAVLFSSLVFSHTAAQESSEPTGQIAYTKSTNIDGISQKNVCIFTFDSLNEKCISNASNDIPIWSPNGNLLAFRVSFDEKLPETHLYDIKSNSFTVMPTAWYVHSWSPDGSQFLVTDFYDERGFGEIATVDLEDYKIERLTENDVDDARPSWSPDGKQIVYLSGYPDTNLIVMNADGSSAKALTEGLKISLEVQPQWSPDGTQIAFVVNGKRVGTSPTSEVYLINADGSGLRQLTETGGATFDPRWSPDGQQLLFFGFAVGAFDRDATGSLQTEVFRINADGSNLINLTQNVGLDYQPTWSPDGEWIAFTSSRIWESENGRSGIFIMRPDGSDLQMLTNEPPLIEGGSSFNNPIWRPE